MNQPIFKIKLKVGDLVEVRTGKEKGKTGKITATHPKLNKVTVEGINVVKRAMKPNRTNPRGGFVQLTKPVWVSKVGLIDPTKKKITRIGYQLGKDGQKVRIYKASGKPVVAPKVESKKTGGSKK